MYKRFVKGAITIYIAIIIVISSFVFIVDPFCHYHAPWLGLEVTPTNEIYYNPGIAQNTEYNNAIIGTSMTENFRVSWFEQLFGGNTVKLSYSGGTSENMRIILEKVFFSKNSIDRIFWGMDLTHLTGDTIQTRHPLPEYLYDDKWTNDVNYLLNKEVILEHCRYMLQQTINIDDAYTWDDAYVFSEEEVLYGRQAYVDIRPENAQKEQPSETLLKVAEENLNKILPFIQNNPDTTFYIFTPPYSILYWDAAKRGGTAGANLDVMESVIGKLLEFPNVKIFYFQNDETIITNLNNYKDYTHYSKEISYKIAVSMQEEKYMLSKDNYKHEIDKMRNLVNNYDYEQFFQ